MKLTDYVSFFNVDFDNKWRKKLLRINIGKLLAIVWYMIYEKDGNNVRLF